MKYSVIYADPPWHTQAGRKLIGYKKVEGKQIFQSEESGSRKLAYPTMTVAEIADLPVVDLAADDAHLYLWVTNQYLLEAKQVITAWGFKYSTTITWCKKPKGGGLGGAHKISTEFLLFCRRGKLKAIGSHIGTHHHVKRAYNEKGHPEHSRKPEYFANLIEKVSPGPYLEMFARRERPGWHVWGNQVENSIDFIKIKNS